MQENLEKTREVFLAERFSRLLQSRALIRGRGDEGGIGAADARDEKIPKMTDRFAAEMLEILSFGEQPVHERKDALRGSRFDGLGQLLEDLLRDNAEQFPDLRVGDVRAAIGA